MVAFSAATLGTIAIVGTAVGVAGTAFSVIQQQKAAGQQRKARRAQQRQQNFKLEGKELKLYVNNKLLRHKLGLLLLV